MRLKLTDPGPGTCYGCAAAENVIAIWRHGDDGLWEKLPLCRKCALSVGEQLLSFAQSGDAPPLVSYTLKFTATEAML